MVLITLLTSKLLTVKTGVPSQGANVLFLLNDRGKRVTKLLSGFKEFVGNAKRDGVPFQNLVGAKGIVRKDRHEILKQLKPTRMSNTLEGACIWGTMK